MQSIWIPALAQLIANAPGNADAGNGQIWLATPDRLGESDAADVLANRIHYRAFEAEDVLPEMPFFLFPGRRITWGRVNARDLRCTGEIELAYAETTTNPLNPGDPIESAAEQRASEIYFTTWVDELIRWIAENHRAQSLVPISMIEQTGPPQRTPINERNPDEASSDYWEVLFRFSVGR